VSRIRNQGSDPQKGSTLGAAIGCVQAIDQSSSIFFPADTFHRTSADGFFDAVFGTARGKNDLGFFFIFVKSKHFGAQLDARLAAHAFIRINHNSSSHITASNFVICLEHPQNSDAIKAEFNQKARAKFAP